MSRLGCLLLGAGILCAWFQTARGTAQIASDRESIGAARELFDLFRIDEAAFERFALEKPFDDSEREMVARVLMRLPQFKSVDVARWTKRNASWDDVARRPAEYHREFLRVEGRLQRVTRIVPAEDVKARYALESYYRCEMVVGDDEPPMIVFARAAPKKWPTDRPIDEPASVNAVFLKTGAETAAGHRELYFAADRIAWHPATPLGKLGMDYGLFDTVEQQRPITNQDRECFYQMLAAAGRAKNEALADAAVDSTEQLGPLTRDPQAHVGERYLFRGVARRVVKILISDPDTAGRLGFDHYFEVVVFLDLDGVLEVAGEKVGSYPVVYCVRELPRGMPIGDEIGEPVLATGFMFKKWPYTTQMTEEKRPGLKMTSPLLIGKTVIWERREKAPALVGPVVGGMIIGLVVAVAFFAWWYIRREGRVREALSAKRRAVSDGESLNDLKLDVPE